MAFLKSFSQNEISKDSVITNQLTLQQKDSIAKNLTPIQGKAIVYIIRSTLLGAVIKMNIECNSIHIGSTKAEKYIYTILEPRTHTFLAKSKNKSSFELTVEAGKIYFIKQQVKMGFLFAQTGLKLITDEEGRKLLSKCKLSSDNLLTN